MGEDVAGSLIQALADEGEHVDDGSFTLDPLEARNKLREFQIAEPLAYVLLLVEAATLAGLGAHGGHDGQARIAFELGTDTIARFAGVRFDDDELRNPLASVFRRTPEQPEAALRARVMQLLALAANAALAAGAERVELDAADNDGRLRRVTLRPEAELEPSFEQLDEPARGLCFRFCGSALVFGRAAKERALLLAHCELSTTAISLDGERIDKGFAAAFGSFAQLETTQIAMDERGIIGVAARVGSEPARVLIVTRGVLAETVPLPDCRPGLIGVVEVDLRKDLSQRQVLRGREFEDVCEAVRRADERLPWGQEVERAGGADVDAKKSVFAVMLLILAFVLIVVIASLR